MNILILGGTGFIGKALVRQCLERGDVCQVFSRTNEWQDADFFSGIEAVINLAGESIAGSRWTSAVRQRILNSRVETTQNIINCIKHNQHHGLPFPKILLSASALGYYGTHPTDTFDEESPVGTDFLASVCRQWEAQAVLAEALGVRVVRLRFGHVLGAGGGLLPRVALPFQFRVGGYLGSGQQWMSWIHREELIQIIYMMLTETKWNGAYNLCTPYAVTMKEFMAVLGNTLGSKSRTVMPAFMARVLFGEMAQPLLLEGQKGYPKRLLAQGYFFQYPALKAALADIYSNNHNNT